MNELFPPRHPFAARWIWGAPDPAPRNIMRLFRTTVQIENPAGCRLHIAADTRYRLWVNGTWVGRGSRQSMPWLTFNDTWEVTGLLCRGRNTLAVEVYHLGVIHQSRPGLLAELVDGAGRVLAATGVTPWSTRLDRAGTEIRAAGVCKNPQPLTAYDQNHPYMIACYDLADMPTMAG